MAHARLCQVEQHVITDVQQCKVSCSSSLVSCEETEKSSTKALQSCLQTSPKPPLILTVCKNGKEYSTRKRENKASTKRPSNRLEETQKSKRRHLEDFPLVLTPVCSSINLHAQDSIYSPIIITPCTSNFNDTLTTEITGMPITPKSSSEMGASCDEFSQSDSEEPSSVATVDSRTQNTRQRSNSNIVQNSSEVSTPVIPLTSSTITPYSSISTCSITSQFDSLSSPSSTTPSSSCHPSENYTDDEINKVFDSWMDCYELKKKQFINSRNKL